MAAFPARAPDRLVLAAARAHRRGVQRPRSVAALAAARSSVRRRLESISATATTSSTKSSASCTISARGRGDGRGRAHRGRRRAGARRRAADRSDGVADAAAVGSPTRRFTSVDAQRSRRDGRSWRVDVRREAPDGQPYLVAVGAPLDEASSSGRRCAGVADRHSAALALAAGGGLWLGRHGLRPLTTMAARRRRSRPRRRSAA